MTEPDLTGFVIFKTLNKSPANTGLLFSLIFMLVSMVQIRVVRMLMCYRIVRMKVRMPFTAWNCFSLVRMGMMSIGVLMVMDVFHNNMCMPMFMRKQIGNNNSKG